MAEEQSDAFDVFLSYHSGDRPTAFRIAEKLKQSGLEPWLDIWCLTPGRKWQEEIPVGLQRSQACAVLLGPDYLGDWEREELDLALDRAAKDRSFRVFLVLLPGLPEPFDTTMLSPFLSTRTWVDFRKGFESDSKFQYLVNAIKGIPFGPDISIENDRDICPYRGLQCFDEQDTEFFFGRDADVQRLVEKLKTSKFLAVVGPSGSGKSSLVRSGLLPQIRQGSVPHSEHWQIRVFTPGPNPLAALAAQMLRLFTNDSMQKTLDVLAQDSRSLGLATPLALADKEPSVSILLVVDQFEEVFTLCASEPERAQFLANLLYASSAPGSRLVVLITLRADFYPKCAAYPELSARLAAHQFLVSPMSVDGLRQSIVEPARRVGLEFEEGLVETILGDISTQPGALPLLEHALLELWERRRHRMLTLEGYTQSGGIEGAIAKRADAIFESFTTDQQRIVQQLMLRLTKPGEGTEDTRCRSLLSQLIPAFERKETVNQVIHAMVDARLFTTSRDDDHVDDSMVDVSHEALIRSWPRLRGWIEDNRDALREHHRLTEAVQDWVKADHDEELLFRGPRLVQALRWREQFDQMLNESERAFLEASVRRQERKRIVQQRRVRMTVIGLIVALMLISSMAILAFRERQQAEIQRDAAISGQIAARAMAQISIDPEQSVLLAIESTEISRTKEAREALKAALGEYHLRGVLKGHVNEVWQAVFSPDGEKIVTSSDDHTARIWATASQKELAVLGHSGVVTGIAFTPHGQWILTISNDRTARVWDAEKGTPVSILQGHTRKVVGAAFSPDGHMVVTASRDGTARVWDAATGSLVSTFSKHTGGVTYVEFSSNGQWVVSSSLDHTARMWEAKSGKEIQLFQGHTGTVWSVSFSPDGQYLCTASDDHTARIWEAKTGKLLNVLDKHQNKVYSAWFSPNGQYLVTGSTDESAMVWEVQTGRLLAFLVGHTNLLYRAIFSPSGKWVLTASFDGTARLWDWRTSQEIAVLRGHDGRITSATFSPDERWIVTAGRDKTARLWEVTRANHTMAILRGPLGGATQAVFDSNGTQVLVAGRDGLARILDVAMDEDPIQVLKHEKSLTTAVFSPNAESVATAGLNHTIRLWDSRSGTLLKILGKHEDTINRVAFSPDGSWLVSAGQDRKARVWDIKSGSVKTVLSGHNGSVLHAAFGPDGQQILTTSDDNTARMWNALTGEPRQILQGHKDWVYSGNFSPDGKWIVTASGDKSVRIWSAATGQTVKEIRGHAGPVFYATFSPNGRWVLTASQDKTAKLWDAQTEELLYTFQGHVGPVNWASFSPDGKRVVTAGDDSTVRVHTYELPGTTDELLDLARQRVTRTLSPEEQEEFLLSSSK